MTRKVKRILGWTLAVISFSGFTTFFAGIAALPNNSWTEGFIVIGVLYAIGVAVGGLIRLILYLIE